MSRPRSRPRVRVHDGLVGERSLAGTDYLADRTLRAQYETEIAPRTEAQLGRVLAHEFSDRSRVKRVLDVGAGTGAAGRALRAHFGSAIELVSVDRVAGPGILVADVRRQTRPSGVVGRFDLIVAAHLLAELVDLDIAGRADLVVQWCRELLQEQGHLVLIEPAMRTTSRGLLGVRDLLVRAGHFIVAPCLWQGPCPALARPRDFCHDAAPWNPPPRSGRRASPRADFSYLVVRAGIAAPVHDPGDPGAFRVVSEVLVEKGRLRLWGCGGAGRHALVLQKRDRTDDNRSFADLQRGDIVEVDGTEEAADGLRLGKRSRVRRRG